MDGQHSISDFQVAVHTRRFPCVHLFGGGEGGAAARDGSSSNSNGKAASEIYPRVRAQQKAQMGLHGRTGRDAYVHKREGPRAQKAVIATKHDAIKRKAAAILRRGFDPNLKQAFLHSPLSRRLVWAVVRRGPSPSPAPRRPLL
jgi:hypothetical protein